MSHDEADVHAILVDLPLIDRIAALVVSIIDRDPRAPFAIAGLIVAAQLMAKHLPPEQRAAIAWHLAAAIEELEVRWN
jgi:hypothetical protein